MTLLPFLAYLAMIASFFATSEAFNRRSLKLGSSLTNTPYLALTTSCFWPPTPAFASSAGKKKHLEETYLAGLLGLRAGACIGRGLPQYRHRHRVGTQY